MLRMIPVRQKFPPAPPLDIVATLRRDFVPTVKPGARIAVGVGSRGISNLAITVKTVVDILKARGAQPFIIPAMGSHGGATPQGQIELLGEYEVSEQTMGVPIRGAMEVETLGKTEDGVSVVFSREALNSDGIVVINRVKPHTDFGAPLGSGVIKMIAIGFGKQVGAATYHAAASRIGMERVIRTVSTIVLPRVPILAGVALIEDTHHATAKVAVIQPAELETREIELQAEARRMMPKLPFDEMDVLIIDWMGKNITGAGMDPNITGRRVHGYSTALRDHTGKPMIHRLYVRGLTPESHGNAIGIGMADFTTTRLVKTIDASVTAMNAMTALSINSAKIPMAFDTDREGIRRILETVPHPDGSPYRVVRIESTLNLERVEVSEAYAKEFESRPDLEPLGPARDMKFDGSDNLLPIGA